MSRAKYSIFGKVHTWANRADLCARCEQLYRAGDDDAVTALQEHTWPADADDSHRKAIAAFRRADLGATLITDWWPPGAAQLVAEGFTPLEDLTGDFEIAADWPTSHRRSVPETRDGWDDVWDDGQCWFVRSPWATLPVSEVMPLLERWVSAHQRPRSGPVHAKARDERRALIRQFLQADDQWLIAVKNELGAVN